MTPTSRQVEHDPAYSISEDHRPGTRPSFFYKSGPDWPDVNPQLRPVVVPGPIRNSWDSVAERIFECLDSCNVNWSSIDAFALANGDEAKPFCPFIVRIGVDPDSIQYEDAVRAVDAVKEVLTDVGCPEVEVGFMEVTYWGSMAARRSINENSGKSGGDHAQGKPIKAP